MEITVEQEKAIGRSLRRWIEDERRVVTFREVAREIGCHVNLAKNVLLKYYETNPTLYATYLLTGPLRLTSKLAITELPASTAPLSTQSLLHLSSTQKVRIVDMDEMSDGERNSEDGEEEEVIGNDNGDENGLSGGKGGWAAGDDEDVDVVEPEEVVRRGVVLVGQDKLDDKRDLFEPNTLNIHIYSLSPAPINDPAQYLVPNLSLKSHPKYHAPELYGTITGDAFVSVAVEKGKTVLKDGAMDWGKTAVKSKDQTAKEASKPPKKDEAKADKIIENKKTEPIKPTKPVKEVSPSVVPQPSTSKPKSQPQAQTQKSRNKRVITSDTEEDEAGPSNIQTKPEPTSSMVREEDKLAMEAMMDMDDLDDLAEGDEAGDGGVVVKTEKAEGVGKMKSGGGVRKRRKVKRSTQEVNEKGYMVTKDHWSDESYSSEEESQNTAKSSTPATLSKVKPPPLKARSSLGGGSATSDTKPVIKPAGGGGTATGKQSKGQSTLKGFFSKKP